ncbi:MAG: ribbon-helix-helix domain-containing protein [Candidatus Woesearchaeota archaeon]
METISLKMEKSFLNEIDGAIKKYRYSTRTEFIRDSIRTRLSALEKEEAIKKLTAFKGSLKGKARIGEEEAGKLAMEKIAKRFNIKLD